jgi:hypothetical protein
MEWRNMSNQATAKSPDLTDYPELLKPCDVQRILGITRDRTYRLFHSDGFPVVRLGVSSLCIPKARFVGWLGYGNEAQGLMAEKEKP